MPGGIKGVKDEIRVIGIDDGPFDPDEDRECILVGAIYRGNYSLEGVEATWIEVDGMDATERIIGLVMESRHRGQLRSIMLNGITFAGFNVADPFLISERTELPVIAIIEKEPDFEKIMKALRNLEDYRPRWQIIKRAGKPMPLIIPPRRRPIYVQAVNISLDLARDVIEKTRNRSAIPEPLRVAHLISSALRKAQDHNS